MIIATGTSGFIGSNLALALIKEGLDVVAVDRGTVPYLQGAAVREWVDRNSLELWLRGRKDVEAIFHLGACSDTTQTNRTFMMANNLEYTRSLWRWCARERVPFVYASSAATYGDGSLGFDDEGDPTLLRPLNLYGESKHLFDLWVLEQGEAPPRWAGLKYFNVYGPREGHKGRMASVVLHAYRQIKESGEARLFMSHRDGYEDGQQLRDFVFVDDVVATTLHFWLCHGDVNGIYNVGTGKARSFAELARSAFLALGLEPRIRYVPMPDDLRDKYQYFTEAKVAKLRKAGFDRPFCPLEEGVSKYVTWLEANQ